MARCKVGDLAIIVPPWAGTPYTLVRVIRRAAPTETFGRSTFEGDPNVLAWVVEGRLILDDGAILKKGCVDDRCLQPIRDQPGTDETLSWAPVPSIPVEAHQ